MSLNECMYECLSRLQPRLSWALVSFLKPSSRTDENQTAVAHYWHRTRKLSQGPVADVQTDTPVETFHIAVASAFGPFGVFIGKSRYTCKLSDCIRHAQRLLTYLIDAGFRQSIFTLSCLTTSRIVGSRCCKAKVSMCYFESMRSYWADTARVLPWTSSWAR